MPNPSEQTNPPQAGDTRPASGWSICAAEPCDSRADLEVLHCTDDGSAGWVPLCQPHYDRAPTEGLEYIIETHGFIRAGTADGAA